LVLATLLAATVVLLFLKSLRSTLIIATAIPVSLLGAVAVMYFSGFTFNTLTLLALLLLVGVVVDDAIVVLENIYRHRERIEPEPIAAAIHGSRQVVFAVIASSLALVSIFAPVIFMGGIIGKFFQSFAVVVTFGVLVSLFVSLTLTPMLCSRFLKVAERHGTLYRLVDRPFAAFDRFYRRVLDFALTYRWTVVGGTVLVVLSSAFFFSQIGKTFVPEEDEGRFMVIFKAPLGSTIDYTNERLQKIESVLGRHPEIQGYFTAIGLRSAGQVNEGIAFVRMKPRDKRKLAQQDLIGLLRGELGGIPGVRAFAAPVPIVSGARGEALQFVVAGPNLPEVSRLSHALQEKVSALSGMGRLDLDLQMDLPQVRIHIDRTRAADLGLSSREIALAVSMLAGGLDVAKFNDEPGDGERYDIRIKGGEGTFTQTADLSRIFLRTQEGEMIRLDSVAKFEPVLGPAVISRYNLQYAANFFGSPVIPLGEAVQQVKEAAGDLLPPGYTVKFIGQAEEFAKTAENMRFTFLLAIILVYMVLASQFNSFLQPMIIMIAQPLAIIGGLIALWSTGHTLNIYSMIGLVLLIGLVAKNSILLVDLTNQFRGEGKDITTALREACPIRMRPVVMTSMTIIFALFPVSLGLGVGADTNGPLAVAVIGGMISSTLLTLVVVPAVYSLVEHGLIRFSNRRRTPSIP
ncbi:MAG: efflux RND transporter permease subunit, partial [Nitrospirae bacterium]|nr:efflux RND transporter permease subunit [Nitrospirota bacterium]